MFNKTYKNITSKEPIKILSLTLADYERLLKYNEIKLDFGEYMHLFDWENQKVWIKLKESGELREGVILYHVYASTIYINTLVIRIKP